MTFSLAVEALRHPSLRRPPRAGIRRVAALRAFRAGAIGFLPEDELSGPALRRFIGDGTAADR